MEKQAKRVVDILNSYSDWKCDSFKKEEIIDAYATYLLSVSSLATTEDELINDLFNYGDSIEYQFLFKIAKQKIKDVQKLDSDFHLVHCAFPDVREEAIKRLSWQKSYKRLRTRVETINRYGEKVDVSPLIDKIKRETKHLTDVALTFGETYINDHVMWEAGWKEEYLLVYVHSVDETSADFAVDIIKKTLNDEVIVE
ncbi:hypothetical protein [Caldifermentibacillus hisashii]|uniref:hypothetical protein n=1 Tax=Caldifermentibacillus hisashii TaxID=996558 RepID=UPI0022B983E8|nr:hypothetical protein [Caldifermentibacillus hisashii]